MGFNLAFKGLIVYRLTNQLYLLHNCVQRYKFLDRSQVRSQEQSFSPLIALIDVDP